MGKHTIKIDFKNRFGRNLTKNLFNLRTFLYFWRSPSIHARIFDNELSELGYMSDVHFGIFFYKMFSKKEQTPLRIQIRRTNLSIRN